MKDSACNLSKDIHSPPSRRKSEVFRRDRKSRLKLRENKLYAEVELGMDLGEEKRNEMETQLKSVTNRRFN
jgi:hypothetical protein